VGPRGGLGHGGEKTSYPRRESKPDRPARSSVTVLTELYRSSRKFALHSLLLIHVKYHKSSVTGLSACFVIISIIHSLSVIK
jgi:hypothetical protein